MSRKPLKKSDKEKPWNKRKSSSRSTNETRIRKKTFHIYCEGENTEPEYFKSFPTGTEIKEKAIGLGKSRTNLIEEVIILEKKRKKNPDREIWCIFDKDMTLTGNNDADYNNAIKLALSKGYKIGYSNDAFELWFLLHYIDYGSPTAGRKEYYKILSKYMDIDYTDVGKSQRESRQMYNNLLNKQETALKRAEALFSRQESLPYSLQKPCTTVFQLVKELNKCLKP